MKSNSKPALQLESLEPRVLLNAGSFGFRSIELGFVGQTATATVDPDSEFEVEIVMMNLEAFDFGGTLDSVTLDLSNSSPELVLEGWSVDSFFDVFTDISLDSGSGDYVVSSDSEDGITGDPGSTTSLGTFTVVTPSEEGTYTLSLGGIGTQTTFVTNFGASAGNTFFDVFIEVVGVVPPAVDTDWGDAWDTVAVPLYPTLNANGGASHGIVGGINLGVAVDADPDGQPTLLDDGDDTDLQGNDDDGVVFLNPLTQGHTVRVNVTTVGGGFLNAWIDFNNDFDWDDAGEQIFTDEVLLNGLTPLDFVVPKDAKVSGVSIPSARFRLDSSGGLEPGGPAVDGEVEDYLVVIFAGSDFGDAPDSFGTSTASPLLAWAEHVVEPNPILTPELLYLGAAVDIELDGAPSVHADGDDLDLDGDDEDGVIFNAPLYAGLLAEMTVTASRAGLLDAWIDYNGNGVFDLVPTATPEAPGPNPPDEYIPNMIVGHGGGSYPLVAGANVINFFVPNIIDADVSFARFRISTAGGLGPTGQAVDGEVEDYQRQLFSLAPDMGDAPDPYPTLLADDGPVHLASIADFSLGAKRDFETDGMPDDNALGDDEDDGLEFPIDNDPDDEDGVTFPSAFNPGTTVDITVSARVPVVVGQGLLDAWIDWNADGDWNDDGEQIFTSQPLDDGDNTLQVTVPADAALGNTYARFRMSSLGGTSPTGPVTSGEIEDYLVTIATPVYDIDPEEQLFVYLLNMARTDPEGFATAEGYSVSFAGISPQPPLAVNPYLSVSSLFHANEMATNDYFGHTSQVTGDQPNKMAIDAGYPLPFGPNGNQIESIAAGYGTPTAPDSAADTLQLLLEDIGVVPPGHRLHLLGMSGWQSHREIGAGWDFNKNSTLRNYWAIHTAYENTSDLFLTGVVYDDKNNNDRYDANEGLSGITVSTTAGATQTNSQGGWSLPITDDDYIVTATGGSFNGTGSAAVRVDGANMEIDFISGEVAGVVNFGIEGGSGFPEVSVTATDAAAAEAGADTGTFTFTRTGSTDNPMTVNYTVAGTATSGSDYQAIATSVEIPAGQTSTTVTVTPIDDEDTEGQETVLVSLQASLDYSFGSSPAATVNIADDEGVVVDFGDRIAKSVIFTEPDNTTGTISVKFATGSITFEGDNLTYSQQGSNIVVSGAASIADITLDNTGPATSLSAKASGGDGYIQVNNININGSAKDIKGKVIDLGGNLTVDGGLKKLEFHDVADQHLINIGQSDTVPGPITMKFNEIANLSIDSDTAIKSLTFVNWEDDDATQDTIDAPWLGKLTTKQNFPASLNLTDDSPKYTLGGVKADTISKGNWIVNGHGGKISVNSISEDWSATYSGNLSGLATKQNAGGDLTALTAKSVSIKGNYTNGSITLTQPANSQITALAKLNVSGTMNNVNVRSQADLGAITAGRILNCNFFAGVDNAVTQLPTAANDFSAIAAIKSVKLKGVAGETIWLQNSNIAAAELGKITVGFAQTDNADVPFGIATQQFKSIAYKDATNNLKASSPADLVSFPDLDDLIVRLLL